jgi:hypothetical protein
LLFPIAILLEAVCPSDHIAGSSKSSARIISPTCGRTSRVGVNTGVGNGVRVAVGGNHTCVGVGVSVGCEVFVGRGGRGVGAGRQATRYPTRIKIRINTHMSSDILDLIGCLN